MSRPIALPCRRTATSTGSFLVRRSNKVSKMLHLHDSHATGKQLFPGATVQKRQAQPKTKKAKHTRQIRNHTVIRANFQCGTYRRIKSSMTFDASYHPDKPPLFKLHSKPFEEQELSETNAFSSQNQRRCLEYLWEYTPQSRVRR